ASAVSRRSASLAGRTRASLTPASRRDRSRTRTERGLFRLLLLASGSKRLNSVVLEETTDRRPDARKLARVRELHDTGVAEAELDRRLRRAQKVVCVQTVGMSGKQFCCCSEFREILPTPGGRQAQRRRNTARTAACRSA